MFAPVRRESRSPAIIYLVTLFLGPIFGFLLIGRGRWVIAYLLATIALAVSGLVALSLGFNFGLHISTQMLVSTLPLHAVGAFHAANTLSLDDRTLFPRYAGVLPSVLIAYMLPTATALFARIFLIQSYTMVAQAMVPTLDNYDIVLATKFAYGYGPYSLPFGLPAPSLPKVGGEPRRGDVVVVRSPVHQGTDFIVRVIGLPGDVVELRKNVVYLNGVALPQRVVGQKKVLAYDKTDGLKIIVTRDRVEERIGDRIYEICLDRNELPLQTVAPITVPAGHYFLLADNRDADFRADSRSPEMLGLVPRPNFIGRAEVVIWSGLHDEGRLRWVQPVTRDTQ